MDVQLVPIPKGKRFDDLTGRTDFGRWEVLGFAGDRYWWCRCSCARKTVKKVFGGSLLGDKSRSCGCLKEGPALARRFLSPKQDMQVRLGYESGETVARLAVIWQRSEHAIKDAIVRAGGKLRSRSEAAAMRMWRFMKDPALAAAACWARRKTTIEQELEICMRYMDGESSGPMAAEFGMTHGGILNIVKRMGGTTRKYTNPIPFNEAAFDNATENEQASYFCGLLMADGCVCQSQTTMYVSLTIAEEDGPIVESYKAFLRSGHKIVVVPPSEHFDNSQPTWRLSIGSTRLADALAKYGVGPRKSLTAQAQGGMENNPWFWRGMIDGDGWVNIRQREHSDRYRPVIGLCGSHASVTQFLAFARTVTPTTATARPALNIWATSINDKHAIEIIRVLYANAAVALPRKHKTAIEILERF